MKPSAKKHEPATQVAEPSGMVCLRAFTFNNKDYKAGDPFPWQENGCSERRLAQLVNNRRVGPQRMSTPT